MLIPWRVKKNEQKKPQGMKKGKKKCWQKNFADRRMSTEKSVDWEFVDKRILPTVFCWLEWDGICTSNIHRRNARKGIGGMWGIYISLKGRATPIRKNVYHRSTCSV